MAVSTRTRAKNRSRRSQLDSNAEVEEDLSFQNEVEPIERDVVAIETHGTQAAEAHRAMNSTKDQHLLGGATMGQPAATNSHVVSSDPIFSKNAEDMVASSANLRPFCFLELPAEIRNMVYSLLFSDDVLWATMWPTVRRTGKMWRLWPDTGANAKNQVAIVATNHEIRTETSHLLYARTFAFFSPIGLAFFLTRVGSVNRSSIRGIIILDVLLSWPTFPCSYFSKSMTLLRDAARHLETVHIDYVKSSLDKDKDFRKQDLKGVNLAKRIFRQCQPLLEAVCELKGPATAARIVKTGGWDFWYPWSDPDDNDEETVEQMRILAEDVQKLFPSRRSTRIKKLLARS